MAVRPIDGNALIEWLRPYLHTGEAIPADVVIEDIRSMPTLTPQNEPLTNADRIRGMSDDYDLDRLRELMNQRMTMRDDVAERMKLVGGIQMDRLRELVEAERDGRCFITLPYGEEEGASENDPVGPEGEPGVLDSKWYKRAGELIEADRDGRCMVLPCKIGDTLYRIQRFKRGKNWRKEAEYIRTVELNKNNFWRVVFDGELGETVFLTREAAEAALKGDRHEQNL